MKKLVYTSLFAMAIAFSGVAMADFRSQVPTPSAKGGFKGPSSGITTVAEALKAKDDSLVVLTGKIEKETGKEKYLFRDSTGAITVEIDNDDWHGQDVSPSDTVVIHGEVDKEILHAPEIDVDKIIKQ